MSKVDDGWNVIKLPEKGQLSASGAVSDDFYVDDDDILSNTSSDDYADLSNPFNLGKKDVEKVKMISDSFETLTGSKIGGNLKSSSLEDPENPNDNRRVTILDNILSKFDNMKKPELKVWHVAILSSLVTVFIIVGTQRYFELFDGILHQKDGVSVSQNSSNKDLIYSDINFLNHDESVSPTWRPTGQYYVDFDNHIAYPLPQKELLHWQKLKTDAVIMWYTVRSKCRSWLNSESVTGFERQCYLFAQRVKNDTMWARDKYLVARSRALEQLADNFEVLRARAKISLINLRDNSVLLKAKFKEAARSFNVVWHQKLLPRWINFSDAALRNAKNGLNRCNYALVKAKSWIMRKPMPRLQNFGKKVGHDVQRWSKSSGRKMKNLYLHLRRRRPNSMVTRLSAHVKTCKHITSKKCGNWQFSNMRVFNN